MTLFPVDLIRVKIKISKIGHGKIKIGIKISDLKINISSIKFNRLYNETNILIIYYIYSVRSHF